MRYVMPVLFVLLWAVIVLAADWNIETTVQPLAQYCVRVEASYPMGQGVAVGFCIEGHDEPAPPTYIREEV